MKANSAEIQGVLVLAGVGVAGYLIYQLFQGAKAAAGAITDAGVAVYHGAQVLTGPVANVIAGTVLKLTEYPAINVSGNVLFPDGTGAPLSSYAIFKDPAQPGAVFVKDRGSTWQLQPSDADGDWPATYVSG